MTSYIRGNDNFDSNTGVSGRYPCRAWINFKGTSTVTIRASGNFSSVADLGTGFYGATLSTAPSDINYSCPSISGTGSTDPSDGHLACISYTTIIFG